MNKRDRVNIILCGLIREKELLKKSVKDFVDFRKRGLVDKIIFSTWIGEMDKNKDIIELFKKNRIQVLESKEPKDRGSSNIWNQMKSLEVVLNKINKQSFVLKTRSDVYINKKLLEDLFNNKLEKLKINYDLPNGNVFKYKIWLPWNEIVLPFYMADECFFGHWKDIKLLVNYETKYEKEYNLGGALAHVRRFIHPFLNKYPIFYEGMGKLSQNRGLRGIAVKFSKKYFYLQKFGIVGKIALIDRFRRMRKNLKNDRFLELLAAYYSVLYSHFYVESRKFTDCVIFREHNNPGENLNEKRFEDNLTRKKMRFKYGGQIYSYDNKFVERIFNGEFEKKEIYNRLLEKIEEFRKTKGKFNQ